MSSGNSVVSRPRARFTLLLASLLIVPSCTVTTTDGAPSTRGNLAISWSVASTTDPAACTAVGASTVILQLRDGAGVAYGAPLSAPCSAFSQTVTDLPAGTYNLSGYMANATSQPITSAVVAPSVTVTGGFTAATALAFPATAFTGTPGVGTGSVVLSWVVASTMDPAQCALHDAANLVAQLTDTAGQPYGAPLTASCSAFTATIVNVPPAVYALTAQMSNSAGQPVSTAVGPVPITVIAGSPTAQALDFPASAFTGTGTARGSLVATWTLAGTTDPNQCAVHAAANIAIQLTDQSGAAVGAANLAPCTAFAATVPNLVPGSYGVSAQMLDAANQPVSTAVGPVTIAVSDGASSTQAFAFPTDAFTR